MTHMVSAVVPTASSRTDIREPAQSQSLPAAADATRFPDLFQSVRDGEDTHKPDSDGAQAPADENSQDIAALSGTVMPLMFNIPALVLPTVAPHTGGSETAPTASAADGAVDAVRAFNGAAGTAALSQALHAGKAMQSDADSAVTPTALPPSLVALNSGARAMPLVQAGAQPSAGLPSDAVNANAALHRAVSLATPADGNAMASAPNVPRPAAGSDSDSVPTLAMRANPGDAAELAPASFNAVTLTNTTQSEPVKLAGAPAQWQQPLREALGERLQVQVASNSEQAVIRLDPPMLGRIEISIRHEAGALQVHMSASNGEVLRQLQGIGDSLRQDLIHRQYSDVAVVVSSSTRNDADGGGRQRQNTPNREEPGRALHEADQDASAFAYLTDSE